MLIGAIILLSGIITGYWFRLGTENVPHQLETIKRAEKFIKYGSQKGIVVDLSEPIELTPLETEKDS